MCSTTVSTRRSKVVSAVLVTVFPPADGPNVPWQTLVKVDDKGWSHLHPWKPVAGTDVSSRAPLQQPTSTS